MWQKLVQTDLNSDMLLVYVFTFLCFWLFRSLVDPSLASFIVCCPLASIAVSRFLLLLTTTRSWPTMPVHVSTVHDSCTTQNHQTATQSRVLLQ